MGDFEDDSIAVHKNMGALIAEKSAPEKITVSGHGSHKFLTF
jgi:hypothetical protein